jgi:hypothetical protein
MYKFKKSTKYSNMNKNSTKNGHSTSQLMDQTQKYVHVLPELPMALVWFLFSPPLQEKLIIMAQCCEEHQKNL